MQTCDRPQRKRGWCDKHYQRWLVHGDPGVTLSTRDLSYEERFFLYIDRDSSGCWIWTKSLIRGYPQFRADGEHLGHRWAYAHFNGPIPAGMMVCHHCDEPRCVNPDHLFLGTAHDNHADMDAKGRRHRGNKLTPNDVIEIKEKLMAGETCASIAADFGVTKGAISHIRTGRSWVGIGPDIDKVLFGG